MTRYLDDTRFVLAVISRIILGLYFTAAGIFITFRLPIPAAEEGLWFPLAQVGWRAYVYGVLLLVLGALLLIGWRARLAAIASAGVIYLILLECITANPLHNTMNHLLPMLALAMTIVWCSERVEGRWSREQLLLLFSRLILGTIFFFQGLRAFTGSGAVNFARVVYVEPLANSWVPKALLWIAGVTNPYIQVITGVLLVLGLWSRWVSLAMMLFLLSIFIGHLLGHPFDPGDGVHAYAGANLALAMIVFTFSRSKRDALSGS